MKKIVMFTALSLCTIVTLGACSDGSRDFGDQIDDARQTNLATEERGKGDAHQRADDRRDDGSRDDGSRDDVNRGAQAATASIADIRDAADRAVDTVAAETDAMLTVLDIDYDFDGRWDIDVASESDAYEVTVTADGARIEERDRTDRDDTAAIAAPIDIFTAIDAATTDHPGDFDAASFDEQTWEISVRTGEGQLEVFVDAESGQVTDARLDN